MGKGKSLTLSIYRDNPVRVIGSGIYRQVEAIEYVENPNHKPDNWVMMRYIIWLKRK